MSVKALYEINKDGAALMMDGPYPDDRIERLRWAVHKSIDERMGEPASMDQSDSDDDGIPGDSEELHKMAALFFDYLTKERFLEDIVDSTLDKIEAPGGDHD